MKTVRLTLLLASVLGFAFHAGAQTKNNQDMKTEKKVLVVFFSHTGENYGVGNITKGNTHIVAEMIAESTGGKLFEIVPEKE
ncbi:MAG: flavodoxin, partial [Bacteroidales bacterium]|nr:flavodoxin [Bacteroidales bacterium]